ncbi:MAG: hypothetical protein VX498_03620 [Myxococcota bacterium]|nr:hypothetical protein [Myxococcota bacterium]
MSALLASLVLTLVWPAAAEESAAPPLEEAPTASRLRLTSWTTLSLYDGGSWLGGGVRLQGNIYGPVWLSGGIGLDTRAATGTSSTGSTRAIPTHLGVRFEAELTQGIRIRGGGDLLLILDPPPEDADENLQVVPGGQLSLGLSLPLGGPFAIVVEAAAGAIHSESPSPLDGLPPGMGPEPRFQLSVGLDLDLPPSKAPGRNPG